MQIKQYRWLQGQYQLIEINYISPGPQCWHIHIDNYYKGSFRKLNGRWQCAHMPPNTPFTQQDIEEFGRQIDSLMRHCNGVTRFAFGLAV